MTASSYRVLGRGAGAGSGAQSQVLKAGKLLNGGIRLGNITGSNFESRNYILSSGQFYKSFNHGPGERAP